MCQNWTMYDLKSRYLAVSENFWMKEKKDIQDDDLKIKNSAYDLKSDVQYFIVFEWCWIKKETQLWRWL